MVRSRQQLCLPAKPGRRSLLQYSDGSGEAIVHSLGFQSA